MEWQTEYSNGVWSAENLEGTLWIRKKDQTIYYRKFNIPASDAVSPEARIRILEAAGCEHQNVRCTKHSIFWDISTRAKPHEEFCFRCADLPDIEYGITLVDDYSLSYIDFWPVDGQVDYPKEFPDFLEQMSEKQYDDLRLSFCIPDKLISEINRVVWLHYLTLFECYRSDNSQAVFTEISRLEQLRGLYLRGTGGASLDAAAVGELRKLEKLESLRVDCGFPISVEAIRELGTLKNLKTLNLELYCYTEHERNKEVGRAALVSALSSLRSLEKLEFLVLNRLRLSPRDLALPPNLKYLKLEGRVHRFDAAAVKPLVKLSAEDGVLVCRFKGKEAFRIAGDGTTPESRRALVAALREMLLKMPPDDGAKIVEHGMVVNFDAPDLAKLIETELAIKVVSNTQGKQHQ